MSKPTVDVTAGNTTGQGAGASETREQDTRSQRRTPIDPGLWQMGVGMGRREGHLVPVFPPRLARARCPRGGRVRSPQVAPAFCKFIAPFHLPNLLA